MAKMRSERVSKKTGAAAGTLAAVIAVGLLVATVNLKKAA